VVIITDNQKRLGLSRTLPANFFLVCFPIPSDAIAGPTPVLIEEHLQSEWTSKTANWQPQKLRGWSSAKGANQQGSVVKTGPRRCFTVSRHFMDTNTA
jgi:hypothetical protein